MLVLAIHQGRFRGRKIRSLRKANSSAKKVSLRLKNILAIISAIVSKEYAWTRNPYFSRHVCLQCFRWRVQSNLTCTWFGVAANKNHPILSGRARDTGKLKKQGNFWLPRRRKECGPEFKTLADYVIPTSFPGSLFFPPQWERERPWLNLVTWQHTTNFSPVGVYSLNYFIRKSRSEIFKRKMREIWRSFMPSAKIVY